MSAPVFVLTHHGHDPIQMDGGTTFHFVTEGFDAAYSAACQAAGDNGVDIAVNFQIPHNVCAGESQIPARLRHIGQCAR